MRFRASGFNIILGFIVWCWFVGIVRYWVEDLGFRAFGFNFGFYAVVDTACFKGFGRLGVLVK